MNGPTQGAHSSTELFCVRGAQIFSLLFCLFCLFNNRNHKDDLDLTMPYLYLSYCSFVLGPRASWPVLHPSCFPLPLHSKQTVFLSLIETTDTISKIIILEQNPAVTPWGSLLTLISTDISPWNACMSLSYRRAFCILLQPCAVKAFHGLQGCSVTVLLLYVLLAEVPWTLQMSAWGLMLSPHWFKPAVFREDRGNLTLNSAVEPDLAPQNHQQRWISSAQVTLEYYRTCKGE